MKYFNHGISFLMILLSFYNFCMACYFEVNFIDEKYDTAKIHSNHTQLEQYGIDPLSGFPNLYVLWLLLLSGIKIKDVYHKNYVLTIFSFMLNFIYKIEVVNMEITESVKKFNQIDIYISLSASLLCTFNMICNYILKDHLQESQEGYNILD